MDSKKIAFLLIGAQKCATTWMYHCLNDHPQIYIGGQKKEASYMGNEKFQIDKLAWLNEVFSDHKETQLVGHASTNYFYDFKSLDHVIGAIGTHVKCILHLRDPLDRTISAYNWLSRHKKYPHLTFPQALEKALDDYEHNRKSFYSEHLIERSCYAPALKYYLERLPHENILINQFEDIANSPRHILRRTYQFLGVDDDLVPLSFYRKPKADPSFDSLRRFERLVDRSGFLAKSIRFLNEVTATLRAKKRSNHITWPDSPDGVKVKSIFHHDGILTRRLIENMHSAS